MREIWPFHRQHVCVCYLVKKLIILCNRHGPINLDWFSCPLCCNSANKWYLFKFPMMLSCLYHIDTDVSVFCWVVICCLVKHWSLLCLFEILQYCICTTINFLWIKLNYLPRAYNGTRIYLVLKNINNNKRYLTTTKHSKAWTVCINLVMYCTRRLSLFQLNIDMIFTETMLSRETFAQCVFFQ